MKANGFADASATAFKNHSSLMVGELNCKQPSPQNLDWHEEMRGWEPLIWPEEPIRPKPPSLWSLIEIRLLAVVGVASVVMFFVWLCGEERRGDGWLFWPLVFSLGYSALWWVMEWLYYVRPRLEPYRAPHRAWTVDVLTTACPGEPRGMILRTLLAMQAIRYPHTSYLCDEGDDPVLREACRQLGIIHVTRNEKRDAKAGNINNALARATGEIAVVLDPDHEPSPYFLDRVLGYFEDDEVGFVQSVQAYRNMGESFVAEGAAKQTYLFYGPIMIGMNAYGTTQAIGANCAFRRAALDSIGGHAAGLSEDMHTTMRLYARGWRSVYVPEVLTRGLVPSSLPAYCKQQLKWACGSIELLLGVYPRVFRGLTFWQRLHYFLAPMYFLRGLVGLINIAVPILCLAVGGVGLRIDVLTFLAMFGPAVLIAILARQVAQRWAIEPHELGTQLVGGLLGFGCWWPFLRGTLCALFRIRLPYIPTSKETEHHDCWRLVAPNLVVCGLTVVVVVFGLWRDWTPFNLLMAAFALLNVAQLSLVSFVAQERTRRRIRAFFAGKSGPPFDLAVAGWMALWDGHRGLVSLLRERAAIIAIPMVLLAAFFFLRPDRPVPPETAVGKWKDTGGFYVGMQLASVDGPTFDQRARELNARFRLFSIEQKWAPENLTSFPEAAMRKARARGAVPLITWLPQTETFPELRDDPDLAHGRRICFAILRGDFDDYLGRYAARLREFGDPVLIRFAPEPDNPAMPWSSARGNSPREFVAAWIYVVSYLNKVGATNVGWVWQPATPGAFSNYFPGRNCVDWVAVNAGHAGQREFADSYRPFSTETTAHRLPVMLTDFASADIGWLKRAFNAMANTFPEVHALLLAEPSPETKPAIAAGLALAPLQAMPPPPVDQPVGTWREQSRVAYQSRFISGEPGRFELTVNGEPTYIRGVAYNPGHDWRDGNRPLTRRELDADLASVQALGANTIRRYGTGWYDRNLFNVAAEKNLRILYGFWLKQDADYASDERFRKLEEEKILDAVREWKDQPSLLAWSLGNEVWGLLKHHYAQPYLTEVRHAHIDFVERLAQRIHEIDPEHPVFVAHEHSPELAGTLSDFVSGAPSIDFTAVNSYFERRISDLRRVTATFDPRRPYLISEFGTEGYWDPDLTRHDSQGLPLEPGTGEKIAAYERGWKVHAEANRGANIGAVAYCWRDRLEMTTTWFGLIDAFGRPKPSYFALQKIWNGAADAVPPRMTAMTGGAQVVAPGETIEVRAQAQVAPGKTASYRWQLSSRDFDLKAGRIRPSADGATVQVTMPQEPGAYRLYVNVSDGTAADEANFPITVRVVAGSSPVVENAWRDKALIAVEK